KTMSQEELEQLSKQEYIEIILRQLQQITELSDAFKKLKADHEALIMKQANSTHVLYYTSKLCVMQVLFCFSAAPLYPHI
ncbi:MAG: hypothetical protein NTZ74_01180, partial [Chloroflexi bacterium]|nr:hypothetical protein [Chloroflexota bacterium]